ncbi:hypothetical protein KFL_002640200 [Klebsormidium nitens]|uniref:Uncharacterized protein n=1 Tax=Klebsormidium nitens TaxID=105231 RepID=A0A0U9HSR5_KLENI|nr:hypothetical protein KFL_002640200 [Klebsormidium nitens]|eukprot:GAQ85999.1 hypothetical protein KFL_002640200 [Klebsormidium nitens]
MRVRSAREFDVTELVEILNSEEQTSSSSLPSPMPNPGAAEPQKQPRKGFTTALRTASWSSINPQDGIEASREGRAWGGHVGYSFSPPERDPPRSRKPGGSSDEVKEQMAVLRSLTESDKLVQQLRAERRVRKESRGRTRREVPPDPLQRAFGKLDPLRWTDTTGVSEPVADDPFLQAIALEDSLLGEDASAFPGIPDLDYLDSVAGGDGEWKGARQAGVQPAGGQLESEWQSLAALLERSLAGLGAGHGGDTPVGVGSWKHEPAPRYEEVESLSPVEPIVQLMLPRKDPEIHQVAPSEERIKEGPAAPREASRDGKGSEVAFKVPSARAEAVTGEEVENNLTLSSTVVERPAGDPGLGSERDGIGKVEEKRVRSEQTGHPSSRTEEGARNTGSGDEVPLTARERSSGGEIRWEDSISRLTREVEEKTGEVQQLRTRVQALEAEVSEKDRAATSLAVRLEQQQAEHARVLQHLEADFETEIAALRDQAKKEAGAASVVFESRVLVAERALREGAAQGEEQLREARRREARLQETNKALLQRVKFQKAENEALARNLETAQTAAKDSAALLESARREAKALRARADELAGEREAEKAGGERAREAGARMRRELAEAKAAAKAAEAAQVRCQAEVVALRKRLTEAESSAEQERAQRETAQAEYEDCRFQVLQLTRELETLQTRLRTREAGQSPTDRCRPVARAQGLVRGSEHGLRGQEGGVGRQRAGAESCLEQETDEDSVSFLTPSPDTSPDKQEQASDWGPEGSQAGKARPGYAGAPTARSISFAEPLTSNEGRAEARVPVGAGERQTGVPEKGEVQATASLKAGVPHQSLSSSDSSLDGPPKPWAWAPVTSRAVKAPQTKDAAYAEKGKRDGCRTSKGSDALLLASGEAQSKFHDLKEAYLRVLQTKGLRVPH